MGLHRAWKGRLSLVAALIMCCAAPWTSAQQKQLTPEELTKGSDMVAVGKVKGLASEWTAGKKAIVTRVTVAVDEYLKGGSGQTVTVVIPGGEVDGVGELYSHTPRFKQDEEVVLFGNRQNGGEYKVSSGDQGKMDVQLDEKSGRKFVSGGTALDDLKRRVKNAQGG